MSLLSRIRQTIAQKAVFQQDDLILVAVSGGADSVALLLILKELGYRLEVLHCNFHLRGEESDCDKDFVLELCERLGILLHVCHFQTADYARQQGISIEMAAREQRYNWFREMAESRNAQAIAVAHHRDDQAETLLLNIIRGTGLRGLAGMHYVNGLIRRPLLDISRKEILAYLEDRNQDYVTDSTNLEREAVRNRIRLDIIPALTQLNPNISETLSRLAGNIQDALPIYEKGLDDVKACNSRAVDEQESCGRHSTVNRMTVRNQSIVEKQEKDHPFSILPFNTNEATLTLLHEATQGCGFSRTQLLDILKAGTGKMIETNTHRLLRDRDTFILHNKAIPCPTPTYEMKVIPANEVGTMTRGNAYLDKDIVTLPLQQRTCNQADRFTPFGMRGSRLVSDYMTDLKLNRFEKEMQQVVTDADGHIVWILGHTSDNHYRISPTTREVLILTPKFI